MDETNRKSRNVAVEQMIGNMTSDLQNADGQYIQLGFTPPQSPAEMHWASSRLPQNPFMPHYLNPSPQDPQLPYPNVEQQLPVFPQQHQHQDRTVPPFNYMQNHLFTPSDYDKHLNPHEGYLAYKPDINMSSYRLFMTPDLQNRPMPDHRFLQNLPEAPNNHTQLIDNLVGNWVPNTSGTYSPFGNVEPSIQNFFKPQPKEEPHLIETRQKIQEIPQTEAPTPIQLNRDVKKPTAEVKPMRPSYSDVLTKSVPPKTGKPDPNSKDLKQKPEKTGKKNGKSSNITSKTSGNSNRTNTSTPESKEKPFSGLKPSEKILRDMKPNQLNRKWASLDNVNSDNSSNAHPDLNLNGSVGKKGRKFEENGGKSGGKVGNKKRTGKNCGDWDETDSGNGKNDDRNVLKPSVVKKVRDKMNASRSSRNSDGFGGNERPPGKRGQRARKRDHHMPFGECFF